MGSTFVQYVLDDMDEAALRRWFAGEQEHKRFQRGHDTYSGTVGMVSGFSISRQPIEPLESVRERMEDGLCDTGEALAVRVTVLARSFREAQPKRHATLSAAIAAARDDARVAPATLLKRIQSQSSKTRRCGDCGSSVAVAYLRALNCPVCGAHQFCVSPTDATALSRLTDKLARAERALVDAETTYNAGTPRLTKWFVGAWCKT
jgi:Zn finger protein HypA/HybF involved in hydrogenase expression